MLSILLLTLIKYQGIVALVFGLLLGSFFNVIIYRLPIIFQREQKQAYLEFCKDHSINPNPKLLTNLDLTKRFNLAWPPSSCPHCHHQITATENIPLFSYLLLQGKCSKCKHKISWRYPLIELSTALLTLVLLNHFGLTKAFFAATILTYALLILSAIDFDTKTLPDSITLPFIWLGLLVNSYNIFTNLNSAVLGAITGYLSLWSVYKIFKLVTHKEGMGYGDFKLLAMLGAWLGLNSIPIIILLSSLIGSIVGCSLILLKQIKPHQGFAFGPYLALSGLLTLLYQAKLYAVYWHLLQF